MVASYRYKQHICSRNVPLSFLFFIISSGKPNGSMSGRDRIWLEHISCDGDEKSVLECEHKVATDSRCGSHQSAAIICGM